MRCSSRSIIRRAGCEELRPQGLLRAGGQAARTLSRRVRRRRRLPATLAEYVARVVTPTLERHKQGGAVAEKFEAAYLRSLAFDAVDAAQADRVYRQKTPSAADYKLLQDYLFRTIAAECGRLGMAVHLHTMAGAGSYFDVAGANPLNLEPVLDDPSLRKTNFVMVHGGWPFTREINALLQKPNAYLDFSAQSLLLSPATLAGIMREWLEHQPEKVMFGDRRLSLLQRIGVGGERMGGREPRTRSAGPRADRHAARWRNHAAAGGGACAHGAARKREKTVWHLA